MVYHRHNSKHFSVKSPWLWSWNSKALSVVEEFQASWSRFVLVNWQSEEDRFQTSDSATEKHQRLFSEAFWGKAGKVIFSPHSELSLFFSWHLAYCYTASHTCSYQLFITQPGGLCWSQWFQKPSATFSSMSCHYLMVFKLGPWLLLLFQFHCSRL